MQLIVKPAVAISYEIKVIYFLQSHSQRYAVYLPFSDACIEERRLIARVGAHKQEHVSLFNASNASVKQIFGTQISSKKEKRWKENRISTFSQWTSACFHLMVVLPRSSHGKHLLSAEVITVQTVQQVFQGNESLCIHQTSNNTGNVASFDAL